MHHSKEMTAGRKPKPTALKLIQGTYRPDRANPNEHKTESLYGRYAIVARQDLVDGIKRLADYRAGVDKTPGEKKVVEIKEAAK